ncbi:MAG: TonB-dependent receptor, partial [Pseudomonadota bacterium]
NFAGETDNNDFSIKTGLQWDFHNDAMMYFTYAQGYKGPGFNVFYNMGTNDTLPIGEETSDSYEIGIKYATNSLIANLAVFRTDIDGFQANNFDNSTGVTITRLTNAGSVETQGVELDIIWNPVENFTLSGGFAAVDAEIKDFNCPIGETCTNRSGADVPFAPDLKVSLNANYVIPMPAWKADIILDASYIYTDEQFSTLPNNSGVFAPAVLLPDYNMINASVGLSFSEDKYRVTLIGKNLGDESFATTYSGDGFRYQIPRDADRYFGVNFRATLE